jgi:hypothetical protein
MHIGRETKQINLNKAGSQKESGVIKKQFTRKKKHHAKKADLRQIVNF